MYDYNEKLKLVLESIKSEKQDKIVMKQFFRENYEVLTKIKTAAFLKDLKGNDKIREFCLVEGIISSYEELKDSKIDNYLSEIKKERHGRTRKKSKPVFTAEEIDEQTELKKLTLDRENRLIAYSIIRQLVNDGQLSADLTKKTFLEEKATKEGFRQENYKDTDAFLLFLLKIIKGAMVK